MIPELYFLMRDEGDGNGGGEESNDDSTRQFQGFEDDGNDAGSDDGGGSGDGEGGGEGGAEGEGSGENKNPQITDEQVMAVLKAKGFKADTLEKLLSQEQNYGGTVTKHQQATNALKALRSVLGDDYESVLAKGMKQLSGEDDGFEDDGDNVSAGYPTAEPEHFKNFDEAGKNQIRQTFRYNMAQELPRLLKIFVQESVKGVQQFLADEKAGSVRGEIIPDYEDNQEAYDGIRAKYGITGNSKEALELIKEKYEQEAQKLLSDRADQSVGKRRNPGTPPPKGTVRTQPDTETNYDDKNARKKRYQEVTKRKD